MAIGDNKLGYSGRLIHSMLVRQLDTCKLHELWFVFGKRPLRFSLQEFHAVTSLKCEEVVDKGFGKWVDDKGFWCTLLKSERNTISIQSIRKEHIRKCKDWTHTDRVRLVYVCIIGGLLFAKDEKSFIPHKYIRLVMKSEWMQAYHWGLDSFDLLLQSVDHIKPQLSDPSSYVLHDFSYALQIWAMEAIPDIGKMIAKKIVEDRVVFPRLINWSGGCVLKYPELRRLESHFKEAVLHPFICFRVNTDIVKAVEFMRETEMRDERVELIYQYITDKRDWSKQVWEVVVEEVPWEAQLKGDGLNRPDQEPEHDSEREIESGNEADHVLCTPKSELSSASTSRKGKRKVCDRGPEEQKQKVLFEKASVSNASNNEDMKSFMLGMFTSLWKTFDAFHTEFSDFKDVTRSTSMYTSRVQSAALNKAGNAATRSQKSKSMKSPIPAMVDNLMDIKLKEKRDMDLDMDDWLNKKPLNLSQRSVVNGFDPTPSAAAKSVVNVFDPTPSAANSVRNKILPPKSVLKQYSATPTSTPTQTSTPKPISRAKSGSKKVKEWLVLALKDNDEENYKLPDRPLVLIKDKEHRLLQEWSTTTKTELPFGPTMFSFQLANMFMFLDQWLKTEDMDAYMFFLREKTSLGHMGSDRVAFMPTCFGCSILFEYKKFETEKKDYVLSPLLVSYGKGERPSHGRTDKVWDVDVDRVYVPYHIHNNHWIALCINFAAREVLVFDSDNGRRNRELHAFEHMIPRIVMVVQSPKDSAAMKISTYKLKYVPMETNLNRSQCDCGPYALKFIEADMLGLDKALLNDENIGCARQKMATDMFIAANDLVFVERMSKSKPPVAFTDGNILEV